MLCNGAKLFRAFLCLVAQRKGMVIMMKQNYSTPILTIEILMTEDIILTSSRVEILGDQRSWDSYNSETPV